MRYYLVFLVCTLYFVILMSSSVSAAHFLIGQVNDSFSGEPADGREVVVWNPINGIEDNITDVIGPGGNSFTSNFFMVDCELLSIPCIVGDILQAKVVDQGGGFTPDNKTVAITGAGFDVVSGMRLNSPPIFREIYLDDEFLDGEIDLIPNATKTLSCSGVIVDYDGDSEVSFINSSIFDFINSYSTDADDNNLHYTNTSCNLDPSYGDSTEVSFNCSYGVWYYANSNNWNCSLSTRDSFNASNFGSNTSFINGLLALGLPDFVDFGSVGIDAVTEERQINITNFGNVEVNISLSGYAISPGDNLSMNCSLGALRNISIEHAKYNLTSSNSSSLLPGELEGMYLNLSADAVVRRFDLDYRQDDLLQNTDEINYSYWRMYAPTGVSGTCNGNIVIGAVRSEGT